LPNLSHFKRGTSEEETDEQKLQSFEYKDLGHFQVLKKETTHAVTVLAKKPIDRIVDVETIFHPESLQIARRTTILPPVAKEHNGDERKTRFVELFDEYGNLTESRSAKGIPTKLQHDVPKSSVLSVSRLGRQTEYTPDKFGRMILELGPLHEAVVDPHGEKTASVRRAIRTVFDEMNGRIFSTAGFLTKAGEETTVNPIDVVTVDLAGRAIETVSATKGALPQFAGRIHGEETLKTVRRRRIRYDDINRMVTQRLYHRIPASGDGIESLNYVQSIQEFDALLRTAKSTAADGTVYKHTYNARGLKTSESIGTTQPPPKLVRSFIYDDDLELGRGNLTQLVEHLSKKGTARVRSTQYDAFGRPKRAWQGDEASGCGPAETFQYSHSDHLVRRAVHPNKKAARDNEKSGKKPPRQELSLVDVRGQVYEKQQRRRSGDDEWFDSLLVRDRFKYDGDGNLTHHQPAGTTATVEVVPNSWTTGGRKQERGPGRRCVRVRCECAGCR